ncbi:MAG: glycosyltransferase family 4 protein [Patescibacteria group bacterium]
MRIMVLTDCFPPLLGGGAAIIAQRLSLAMQKAGHEIFVFSICQKEEDAGEREVDGLRVFFLRDQYNPKWRGWLSLYNRKVLSVLEKHLADFRPDVVQAHNIHSYISYACLKLSKKYCRKVFLTAHDVDIFHQDKFFSYIDRNNLTIPSSFNYKLTIIERIKQIKQTKNPFRSLIIKYYLKNVNRIIPVSQALEQALKQNGITKLRVIHNGIEPGEAVVNARSLIKERFNIDLAKKIILIAGRFGGLKGGDLILKYVQEIKKSFSDFVFAIASDKYQYNENIFKQAKAMNLSEHLVFTGWLNYSELRILYSGCDVCFIPSVCFDSFPNDNLEAMSFKKPVVGTCFGGTPEAVVDGETGYVVNPFNILKVAEKIVELLNNSTKAEKMGEAGFRRVKEKFSLSEQINKYFTVFFEAAINKESNKKPQ